MKNMKRILSVTVKMIPDTDPDTSYLEQDGFEDRLDQYRRDGFSFVGIKAVAEFSLPVTDQYSMIQTIHSGGLWGIEDDSKRDYFLEVAAEELSELKQQLHAIGFSHRAIEAAYRDVVYKF